MTAKTPLIGNRLRRRAVALLDEDGSSEAVIALAEAAARGLGEVDPVRVASYVRGMHARGRSSTF